MIVSQVRKSRGPGAPATARGDARSAGGLFNIPGPQKRGTGGTLNLIKFRMRQGPPAEHWATSLYSRPGDLHPSRSTAALRPVKQYGETNWARIDIVKLVER